MSSLMNWICASSVSTGVDSAATVARAYHPAVLLKLATSTATSIEFNPAGVLRRKHNANVEVMWLTGRLMPDSRPSLISAKTNGKAIRSVCRQIVVLLPTNLAYSRMPWWRSMGANSRPSIIADRNFTSAKLKRRMEEVRNRLSTVTLVWTSQRRFGKSRWLAKAKAERLHDKIAALKKQMRNSRNRSPTQRDPDKQISADRSRCPFN